MPLAFPHPPPAPQHRTSNSSITSSSTSLSSDDHSSYLPPLSVGGSSSAFSSGRSTRINSLNSLTSEGHAYALAPSPGSEGVYRRLSVREEEAEEAAAGGIGGLGQFGSRKESEDSVGGGWTRRPSDIDPLVLGNSFKNSHVRNGSNTSASSSTNGGMFAYGSSDLPTLPSLRSLSLSAPAPPLPSSSAGPRPSSSGSSSAFFPSVSPFSTLHPPSNANAGFTGPPPSTVPSSRYLPSSADPSSPTRPNSAPWSEGVYRAETMGWGSHVVNEMVDDANAGLLGSTEGASDPSSQRAIRMGSEGEEPPHHQRRISSGLGWSSRPGGSAKSRGSFGEGTAQIPYHPYASTQRPVATSQHPSFSSSNSRPPTGSSSRAERFGQTFNVPSHSSTTLNRIRRSSLPVSQSLNQFPPLPYLASRSNSIPDPNQSAHGHNQFAYPYTYLTQPPHPTEAHLPAPPPPPSFASRVIFPTPTDESPFGCHQPWHAPQPGSYFDAHFVDISSTASVDSRPSSRPSSSHSRSSAGGSRTGVIVDTAPSSPGPQRAMLTKSSSATRLAGVSSRKSNAKPITIPTPSSTASGSTGSSTSAVKGGSSYVCEFCSKKFNRPSSLRVSTFYRISPLAAGS